MLVFRFSGLDPETEKTVRKARQLTVPKNTNKQDKILVNVVNRSAGVLTRALFKNRFDSPSRLQTVVTLEGRGW